MGNKAGGEGQKASHAKKLGVVSWLCSVTYESSCLYFCVASGRSRKALVKKLRTHTQYIQVVRENVVPVLFVIVLPVSFFWVE